MPTPIENLTKAIEMLTIAVRANTAALAKPPTKRSRRKLTVWDEAEKSVAKCKRYGILA